MRIIRLTLLLLGTLYIHGALAAQALVLQTDFSLRDGAVSAMKGVAFGVDSQIHLFDLTHEIPPYDIWQAAYHLNADRIGHGLTLGDRPELMERFRNRGICLELCPTSNREVVGYRDRAFPGTGGAEPHPVTEYWRKGIALSVCTDNPGISRTDPGRELLAAARMGDGDLTLWDALAITRQGFVHAFLPAGERESLLKDVDASCYRLFT